MDACPRCGRPFSAGEVTGLGILRPRAQRSGGPYVEFACPGCRATHRLVPHGQARYAKPGEPPPPPPPPVERRLPWQRVAGEPGTTPASVARSPSPSEATPRPAGPAPATTPPPPRPRAAAKPAPPSPWEVLGVPPTATREEVEAAFRAKALQCHPDKVAHLDPEFRALAERKFRDLLTAFEALAVERGAPAPSRSGGSPAPSAQAAPSGRTS